jgi:thioredoxin reductase
VTDHDAIIVGGGLAGLSAGLWLARYRRNVRILDSARPRNEATWAVHGYPGLTDPAPHELRAVLLEQARNAGAQWQFGNVVGVTGSKDEFEVKLEDGELLRARRVVLCYGRRDVLPEIEGLEELYGISVFHCPDCDGPSMVGCRLAVYGCDRAAATLALYLLTWARQVTLLTNNSELRLDQKAQQVLAKYDVDICPNEIARLCPNNGRLAAVEFADGDALPLDALFFHLSSPPASDLADQLGCKRDHNGNIEVDRSTETSVPGIYAAGDIVGPPYLAVSAAAGGVKTAITVHKSLLPPDQEL